MSRATPARIGVRAFASLSPVPACSVIAMAVSGPARPSWLTVMMTDAVTVPISGTSASRKAMNGLPAMNENCICTPHIGYVELDNYENFFSSAFDNVVNFIKGTPTNIVNPGALQVRR